MLSQKKFRTIQRYLFPALIILSALFVVLSLSLCTDLHTLGLLDEKDGLYVSGAEIYRDIQPFNKALLAFSVLMVVISIVPMIAFSASRRIYYPSNYITCSAASAYALFMSVFTAINILYYRAMYLTVDFEEYKIASEMVNGRYVKSTFFFDAGIVLCVLTVATVAMIVFCMIVKLKQHRAELKAKEAA